jgi:GNAT superfamily N-acetyltransferase
MKTGALPRFFFVLDNVQTMNDTIGIAPPGLAIRQARPADSHVLSGLMRQLGYEATPALLGEKMVELAGSPSDRILVATLHDEVVGSISLHAIPMFHVAGKLGRITSLVVDERYRSAGIGKALLDAAEQWFESARCVKVEVTSADRRLDAHRFYERHGYARDGRRFTKGIR